MEHLAVLEGDERLLAEAVRDAAPLLVKAARMDAALSRLEQRVDCCVTHSLEIRQRWSVLA
jgi:hypothetical protein